MQPLVGLPAIAHLPADPNKFPSSRNNGSLQLLITLLEIANLWDN
jgi:hypothetical protein